MRCIVHEASLMQGALDLAVQTARDQNASRIHRISLRVGTWSGVVPDALKFAFEVLRAHTLAAEATLEIESIPIRMRCPQCCHEFSPPDTDTSCQNCGAMVTQFIAGRELELASVEISGS